MEEGKAVRSPTASGNVFQLTGSREDRRILVYTRGRITNLPLRELLYAEVRGHHVLLHRLGGAVTDICGSLNELEGLLRNNGFSRCSRYYLLNLRFVTCIAAYTAILADGSEFQISRRRRKSFCGAVKSALHI